MTSNSRISRDRRTIEAMIRIYCRGRHSTQQLCSQCVELLEYGENRLRKCPFGEQKPNCVDCSIHCYQLEMRDRVRRVMRYSGPRMLVHHPILAIHHLVDRSKRRRKPEDI